MAQSGDISLTEHQFKLLARSAGCLFYAASLSATGHVSVDWFVGRAGDSDAFPVRDLLEGRLPAVYTAKMHRHLDLLRAGTSSDTLVTYRSDGGERVSIRDSAHRVSEDRGIVKVLGTVTAVPSQTADSSPGPGGWPGELIESLDQAIAYWTHDRKLLYANRNFCVLFGDVTGQTLDTFLRDLSCSAKLVIDGDGDEWIALNLQNLDAQAASAWTFDDGRSYQVGWRVLQSGIVILMQETTSVRSSERALTEARDLAEQASANKSRFLRAANHDLRQPLATLKILLFSATEHQDLKQHSDLFGAMEVAVSVMEEILESLLQIGQLDANRIKADKQHFQASHLLERLRLQFEPQAKAKQIGFRVVNSVVTLESDRVLLERILGNLIANAIKFTKTGGILLGLRKRGRSVDIQVVDTGPGIPDDRIAFIFQEFYQGEIDPTARRKGLGLGLNIASRLAGLLDHRLAVRSRPGRGTVFSVTVPIGDVWRSKVEQFDIDERIAGEFVGVKVVVVEDDTNLRNAIGAMLARWGVEALSAKDASEALETMAAGGFTPDLAIVDYSLPNGEKGTDAIFAIRSQFADDVPAIVCTAEVERDLIAGIRAAGLPVLTKPVSPARLRSVMHYLLYEQRKANMADR